MSRRGPLLYATTLFILMTMAALLGGCGAPEGNAAEGKRWYRMHNCFACHGENGNDGGAPDIASIDMSYRSFVHRLRNFESPIMPKFSEQQISDRDAADILAFLRSVK